MGREGREGENGGSALLILSPALDTGEYLACLNGSAAGNRAPGTKGIGGWVAYG